MLEEHRVSWDRRHGGAEKHVVTWDRRWVVLEKTRGVLGQEAVVRATPGQ